MLMEELEDKGRLDWVKEECDYLSEVRPMENGNDPLFLRFRGAGRLPRRNLAALEGLLQYRRELAAKKDRPLFKVFSNTALLKIATEMAEYPSSHGSGPMPERQTDPHLRQTPVRHRKKSQRP